MLIPPRRIVLSGGGIRAVAHLGALEALDERGLLKNIKEYIGVSAGAFVGFSLMIGYTLKELRMLCTLFDFTLIRNLDPEAAFEFPTTYGFDDGTSLIKLFQSLLRMKKIPLTCTFAQWHALHPEVSLRCFATDLFTTGSREFSLKKSPNVELVTALRASMCLPPYFTPVIDPETGHLLVDGGIINNFPLELLTLDEIQTCIGISFAYSKQMQVKEIPDLMSYFGQLFASHFIPRTSDMYRKYKEICIIIPCAEYPSWNFEATKEEREEIIEKGKKAAEDFCSQFKSRIPLRRYSVS